MKVELKLHTVTNELLPGLPESAIGGSYKTKILKPLAEVTKEDVLDALPPSFIGGTKSIEKLCYQIRDNLFAQITQLFDDDSSITNRAALSTEKSNSTETVMGQHPRQLVAQYIQECLQQYIDHNCIPPDIGQPYPQNCDSENNNTGIINIETTSLPLPEKQQDHQQRFVIPSTGNITIPRPMEHNTVSSTNEVGTNPPTCL